MYFEIKNNEQYEEAKLVLKQLQIAIFNYEKDAVLKNINEKHAQQKNNNTPRGELFFYPDKYKPTI